ncbi:response regulator [Thalassomonas viridans]|uniref:histidine kinase n=1 Tax=Thalassomonas viridans TaxID=137584 RepID=A0AAE9Z6I9_9GAMM|nr:two-component regulator propeller domain-containing protein [Thalassomonas viridans]WDE07014.1 response regulator [Thalassomonas viridans]
MNQGFLYRQPACQYAILVLFLSLYCKVTLAVVLPPDGEAEKHYAAGGENVLFEQAHMVNDINVGSVAGIIQDKSGYLWLGTSEGLFRYDGYEFKRYLGDDSYLSLHQEPGGALWALGRRSMKKYRADTDTFEVFSLPTEQHKLLADFPRIGAMAQTRDAGLWFFAHGGEVLQYQKAGDRWRRYALFPGDNTRETLQSVPLVDRQGRLLLGVGHQVFAYDAASDGFVREFALDGPEVSITALAEGAPGTLLIGTNGGLYRRFAASGKMQRYQAASLAQQPGMSISSNRVTRILTDNRQNIWVGTQDGLNLFNPQSGTFHRIRHPAEVKVGEFVRMLAQDDSGNVWLSGLSGLYYYAPEKMRLFIEEADADNPQSLSHSTPWSVFFDSRQRFWVGTRGGGLNVRNAGEKNYKRYRYLSDDKHSLSDMSVVGIIEDSRQNIWLATYNGLNLYREQSDDFKVFYFAPENAGAPVNQITSIAAQDANTLWLSTRGGVIQVELTMGDDGLPDIKAHQVFLPGEVIFHVWLSPEQEIWAGTPAGIYRLNAGGEVIKHYRDDKTAGTLSGNFANQVYQDKNGTIWAGTEYGLNKFLPQQDAFEYVPLFGPQTYAGVQNLLEDNTGLLWLVTSSRGVIAMDTDREQVVAHYPRNEGFSYVATLHTLAPDGRIYLGTMNQGLVSFYPRQSRAQKDIQLTRIRVDDREIIPAPDGEFYLKEPGEAGDGRQKKVSVPVLAYNSKNLAFQFSNFEYLRANSVEYQYKLEGFDEKWREASAVNRLASYTNLSPGHHSFRARARLPLGRWSETRFDFFVEYPLWRSWWAYGGYLLCLAFFVYLGGRLQTRVLKKRNKALEQKIALRTEEITEKNREITELLASKNRFYSNISHEFRTPLTVMLLPIEKMLASKEEDKGQWLAAYNQGQRLVKMVDHLIEFSRQDKKTPPAKVAYQPDAAIRQLCESFVALAREKELSLVQDIKVVTARVLLTRDCLEQVLGNLIANAIKYTPIRGKITVTASEANGRLSLSVADTGYGIASEYREQVFERFSRIDNPEHQQAEGIGVGLAIVKEQAELNQGRVLLSSEPGKGSCFTVLLPVVAASEAAPVVPTQASLQAQVLPSAVSPAEEEMPVAGTEETAKEKDKLLIVEDNPDLRQLLTRELGNAYHCLTAKDGAEGIAVAERELPDLIISDIMMPHKNGFELCRSVKQSPLTCHIPVILLTAKGDRASKISGWQCEADDYIGKPFDLGELNCRIDNLINGRKKLAQVHKSRFLSGQTQQEEAELQLVASSGDSAGESLPLPEGFIEDIKAVVEQGYTRAEFSIEEIAEGLHMSSRQLQRKTKALLQISPSDYLKQFRLQQAKIYLRQNMQAASVAHRVGFSSPAYFGSCFKAQYGQTPLQYQQSCNGGQLACQ